MPCSLCADGRVVALQPPAHAAHRAAGAYASHEYVHLAVGIAPYLFGRRLYVGSRVGGVFELLQNHAALDALVQLLCLLDGTRHPFGSRGEYQFGPQGFEQIATLEAHGLGHGEDEVVPPGRSHEGQPHAGVAARGFDEGGMRFQYAPLFGIVDHREGYPVFHAAGRVEILQFGNDRSLQPVCAVVVRELQQRSVPNQVGQTFSYLFHCSSRFCSSTIR